MITLQEYACGFIISHLQGSIIKKEFIAILAEHVRKTHSFCCGLNDNSCVKQYLFLRNTDQKMVPSPITILKQTAMQDTQRMSLKMILFSSLYQKALQAT